ncbi:MAG: pyridoxamine 5'-phosphate oxidase family protein [Acidimicrobiales bacterium]
MRRLTDRAAEILMSSPAVHLATLMSGSGEPKVEPVWTDVEEGRVLVATDAGTIKAANVEADGRVALSATATDNPFEQILIRGRVIELRDDSDLEVLDRLSQRRLGTPFPRRRWGQRLVLVIEPDVVRYYKSPLGDLPDGAGS